MFGVDSYILLGIGGFFIILGIASILWGKHEEQNYYNALSTRPDVREFMEHWPIRPQPGALKIGGWIAMTVGLLVLATGIILLF
ncbi:hypothetical protein ACFLUO_06380 [Chloroflexota bacterium]